MCPEPRDLEAARWRPLGEDLYVFPDTCNVYLLRSGDRAVCVDFGTGSWQAHLPEIGVRQVDDVILTHAHRDQCCGLYRAASDDARQARPIVHAPAGDISLLRPPDLTRFWRTYQDNGCPSCYAAPRLPVPEALPDMATDSERVIGSARFCGLATPGHTPGALTYLVTWRGRQLAFCGDAVCAGGHVHQPYHLEWDHWTPSGALAAWYGLERLAGCRIDCLLPSHGVPVLHRARDAVRLTQRRVMALVHAKGSVCAGEANRWLETESLSCGAERVSPPLYSFGNNGYLLVSQNGDGFVVDPALPDMGLLRQLVDAIGLRAIAAGTASHYHADHVDALNSLRREWGARAWLHPWLAEPLRDRDRYDRPWLVAESVAIDRVLPEAGRFRWREYAFDIRPLPGQTRWHCAFDAQIDGQRVLFSGDSFQPPSRWNGTGGFCAYNGSRFEDGFAPSARAILELAPEVICNGHRGMYRFAPSHYRRIAAWSERAAKAVRQLCPSAGWLSDYDVHATRFEPFVVPSRPGGRVQLSVVHHNHEPEPVRVRLSLALPPGWKGAPAQRSSGVPAGRGRAHRFTVSIPRSAPTGRHVVAADLELAGNLRAEACVALIDVA